MDRSVEVDWMVNVSENEDKFKRGLTNVDILIDYKHQLESNRKDRNIHTHSSITTETTTITTSTATATAIYYIECKDSRKMQRVMLFK